ncbi:MAG: hypothetical protein EOO17_01580 [Chloroflexi bacterium]|nr:MAG: hypothetical protein EOO17_01580 [Chloroflexota bacterium]
METITLDTLTTEMIGTFLLSVFAFLLAMALTPFYTFLAYRFKFWKRQRETSTTGEKLLVFVCLMILSTSKVTELASLGFDQALSSL